MRKLLLLSVVVGCTTGSNDRKAVAPTGAAGKVTPDEPPPPAYELKGDLAELQKKGYLRVLIPAQGEKLQRDGNPNAAEQSLAKALAKKLGMKPVFIEIADRNELFKELE